MEIENIEASVKCAVDSVRKTIAVRRRKNVSYAIVVKVGYEEIQKLRSDGYSYDIICKMLSENGALGVDANPKNLCTAFLRETKRRLSRVQVNSSIPRANVVSAGERSKTGEADKTERDNERTRRMTGRVVDTGLGKIIKNTDGSFDY